MVQLFLPTLTVNAGNKLINSDRRQRAHLRSFSFSTMVLSKSYIIKTSVLLRFFFGCIFSELHRTLFVICERDLYYELLTNATRLLRGNIFFSVYFPFAINKNLNSIYSALGSLLATLFCVYRSFFSHSQAKKNPKPNLLKFPLFL